MASQNHKKRRVNAATKNMFFAYFFDAKHTKIRAPVLAW